MEIIFIGTGSGKTNLLRFHSSIVFVSRNHKLLIDTGDGVSRAILKAGLNFNEINSILLTHYHADHFTGIASLITQMKLNKRKNPLRIYTHHKLLPFLQEFFHHTYLFEETLGFDLEISGFDFNREYKITSSIKFEAKQNSHITNKHKIQNYSDIPFLSSSILMNIENKKIFYTSDIGTKKDICLFAEDKTDILISEVTHILPNEIIDCAKQLKPGKIFLTHFNPDDETKLLNWHKSLSLFYKSLVTFANDGLIFLD